MDFFKCPYCQAKFDRSKLRAGMKFKCKKCQNIVHVPEEEPAEDFSSLVDEEENTFAENDKEASSRFITPGENEDLSIEERQLMTEDTILDSDNLEPSTGASENFDDNFDSDNLDNNFDSDNFDNNFDSDNLEPALGESAGFDLDIVNATESDNDDFDALEDLEDSGIAETEEDFEDSMVNAEATVEDSSDIMDLEDNIESSMNAGAQEEFDSSDDLATQPHENQNYQVSPEGITADDSESAAEAILKGHPLNSSTINQLSLDGQHLPSIQISNSRFSTLEISNSTIDGDLRLSNVNCAKSLKLTNVSIKGELVIHGGTFSGDLSINSSRIYHTFQCSEVEFNGGFFFIKSQAHGPILFTTCKFNEKVGLRHSHILQECSFKECISTSGISFDGSLIKGILDLETTKILGPLSFRKTVADYLNIPSLNLKKPLQSQQEKDPLVNLDQFAFLMEHFRRKGNPTYQDWAFRNYQKARRKNLKLKNPLNWIRRPLDWLLLDLGMGYGTRPLMTLLNMILIFVFYSGGYFYLLEEGKDPKKTETTQEQEAKLVWKLPAEGKWAKNQNVNKTLIAFDYSLQNACFQFPEKGNNPFLQWIYMSQALLNLLFMVLFGLSLHRGLSR